MVMQDVGYELFAESVEKECVFGLKNPDLELAGEDPEVWDCPDFPSSTPIPCPAARSSAWRWR